MVILIIFIILLFLFLVINAIKQSLKAEKEINNKGIEVDSVVSKVERKGDYYNSYVKYLDCNNQEREAKLNVRTNLPIGRKVRIKYLPDQYDYVVFISQELD